MIEGSVIDVDLHETFLSVRPETDPKSLPFTRQEFNATSTDRLLTIIHQPNPSDMMVPMTAAEGQSHAEQWAVLERAGYANLHLPSIRSLRHKYGEIVHVIPRLAVLSEAQLQQGREKYIYPFWIQPEDKEGIKELKRQKHELIIDSATLWLYEQIIREFLVDEEVWDPFKGSLVPGFLKYDNPDYTPFETKISEIGKNAIHAQATGRPHYLWENDRRVMDFIKAVFPNTILAVPLSREAFLEQEGYPANWLPGPVDYSDTDWEYGAYEMAGLGRRGTHTTSYFDLTPLSYNQNPAQSGEVS